MTDSWNWWSRRVPPPGPKGLLRRPFIAIAGLRRHPKYKRKRLTKKEVTLLQIAWVSWSISVSPSASTSGRNARPIGDFAEDSGTKRTHRSHSAWTAGRCDI